MTKPYRPLVSNSVRTGAVLLLLFAHLLSNLGMAAQPAAASNPSAAPPSPDTTPTPPTPASPSPTLLDPTLERQTRAGSLIVTKFADTGDAGIGIADNGSVITYTIVLYNSSASAAVSDILVVDVLPRDALQDIACTNVDYTCIYESSTIPTPSGGTATVTATRQISWFISSPLAAGSSYTLTFRGTVVGQPEGTVFTNRAFVNYYESSVKYATESNACSLTAHVPILVDGSASVSPMPTWFSEDIGGTISQDWGDFDRDGDLDLALGSSLGATVYQAQNGLLEKLWTSPSDVPDTYRLSFGVRWADVISDANHYLELVVVGESLDQTAISQGLNYVYQYDGSIFTEVHEFPSAYQLVRLAAADFDNDQDVDLIGSTNAINASCNVTLYRNNGSGQFTDTLTCLSYYASAALAAGDVDNDGDVDLALGAFPGTLQLLFNRSAGQTITSTSPFTVATPLVLETFMEYLPYDLAWGDYDQDGYLDLAAAYPLQREARVYHNDDGLTLTPIRQRFPTTPFLTPLAVDWGDVDSDGWLDLIVADSPPRIYTYDSAQSHFANWTTLNLPDNDGQVWSIRGIDLRQRDDLDLIITNRDGPSRLFITRAPNLRTRMTVLTPPLSNWRANSIAWGDAEGDGDLDLLLGSGSAPNLLSYLYTNQEGEFNVIQPDGVFDASGFGPHSVAFGDVTADGVPDVAVGTPSAVQIYAAGLYDSPLATLPAPTPVSTLAWADANDDGRLDLLVGYEQGASGSALIGLYVSTSIQPNLVLSLTFTATVTGDVRSLAWGDYDNDYFTDFAVGVDGGPLRVYRNESGDTFTVDWSSPASLPTRGVAWADYDRDGDIDLAVANYGREDQVWENTLSGELHTLGSTPVWTSTTAYNSTAVAWGDWNNDAYPELAVGTDNGQSDIVYANLRSAPGAAALYPMWTSNEQQATTSIAWGDRDGDGDLDLAVSRQGSSGQSGFYENTMMAPAHIYGGQTTATPLPNNPTYLYVSRPDSLADAYLYSTSALLGTPLHPTVTVQYRLYDPELDPVVETLFEYSLDGGGTWHTAVPAAGSPPAITQTDASGAFGTFIWDPAATDAVSDDARFRVRVVHQNDFGPVQHATSSAVSPPFRVRGLDCYWPTGITTEISDMHPDPGEPVTFTASIESASGQVIANWDFDDGLTYTGWITAHTFARDGVYTVTLRVDGPPCPIARPATIRRVITVGVGELFEKIYLPMVVRASSTARQAPPTDLPSAASTDSLPADVYSLVSLTADASQQAAAATTAGISVLRITNVGFESQPAINADGTRLAFWSTGEMDQNIDPVTKTALRHNADGNIEIFWARRDASTGVISYTQVTSSTGSILGGFNLHPSIDREGNTIAFFSDFADARLLPNSNPDHNFEIFVAEISANGIPAIIQVTNTSEGINILPSIDDSGSRIAFVSDQDLDDGQNGDGNPEIFIADISPSGIEFTQITDGADINDQPDISNDGKMIAFVSSDANGQRQIYLADIATLQVIQVTHSTGGVNEQPSITTHGDMIAFVSNGNDPDGLRQVYLARINTAAMTVSSITQLTTDSTDKVQPALSADGSRVAYVIVQSATSRQLGLYNIAGGGVVRLGAGRDIIHPALTSDGEGIAYISNWDVLLTYPPKIDLQMTKTASDTRTEPGSPLTYTLSVVNNAADAAASVVVSDTLPYGLVSAIPANRPDYTDDDDSGSGFGGGLDYNTGWLETSFWIAEPDNGVELPDSPVGTNSWTDMSNNVLLLHLDEAGTTQYLDSSGNGNDATATGDCAGGHPGQLSHSVHFTNTWPPRDTRLTIADDDTLDLNSFTVSLWVRPHFTPAAYHPLIVKEDETGHNRNFGIFLGSGGRIHFSFQDDDCATWKSYDSQRALAMDQWNHVVITWAPNSLFALYVNGVLDPASTNPNAGSVICHNDDPVKIGGEVLNYEDFNGEIDEVAIFSRAMSAEQIRAIYQRQLPEHAGYFDSRVMQASGGSYGWNSIALTTTRPIGMQLPDNGVLEVSYSDGNVDMAGNALLLHLNEAGGFTSFADASGLGNGGICSGSNCPTAGVTGRFGTALSFDGNDDYINLGATAAFEMENYASIEAWIYPVGVGTTGDRDGIIVNKEGEYEVARFADGTIRWAFANSSPGWAWINTNYVAPLFRWTHVVVVYDVGIVRTYADGNLVHIYNGSGVIGDTDATMNDLRVGGRQSDSTFFHGRIDEVALYARALDSIEIEARYQRGALQMAYQVRSCPTATCTGVSFTGPDGTRNTYYPTLGGASVAYFQDFEDNNGSYTHSGTYDEWQWGLPLIWPGRCASGTHCWGTDLDHFYENSSNQTLQSPAINLSSIPAGSTITVDWWQALEIESSAWDHAYADVYINGTWINMWNHTAGTIRADWTQRSFDISSAAGSTIYLRWRLTSDGSIVYSGYYIDAVRIVSQPPASDFEQDYFGRRPSAFLVDVEDQPYFQYRVFLEAAAPVSSTGILGLTVSPRVNCAGGQRVDCYLDPYMALAPNRTVSWEMPTAVTLDAYSQATTQGSELVIVNTAEAIGIGFELTPADNVAAVTTTLESASVGDWVWEDMDGDGIQDAGEPGLSGVTVRLILPGPDGVRGTPDDSVVMTTTTDTSGYHLFSNPAPEKYYIRFTAPSGYFFTLQDQDTNDALDNDANQNGLTEIFGLSAVQDDLTRDGGLYRPASIGNYVWEDMDGDGLQTTGEPGLPNVTVQLYQSNGTLVATTATDDDGLYGFSGLRPGNYYLHFTLPSGYVFTPANQGNDDTLDSDANTGTGQTATTMLTSGENDTSWDAGLYRPVSIGDYAWEDMNGNGIQEVNEPGINSLSVTLYRNGGNVGSTTTNSSGVYTFANRRPGTYYVRFTAPQSYVFTPQNQGADDALDSDANPATGQTHSVLLLSGQYTDTLDAGLYRPVTIGDYVWGESDQDGIQESGEPGLDGVTVRLYAQGVVTPLASTVSANGGAYGFPGLAPGIYWLEFITPTGYLFTLQDQDSNDELDSDADPTTGHTITTTVVSGGDQLYWDAGFRLAALGDYAWEDMDGDGVQEAGEPGLDGVTVTLYAQGSSTPLDTAVTANDGAYAFVDLLPNTYYVEFTAPAGYSFTLQNQGTNGTLDSDASPLNGHTQNVALSSGEIDNTLDAGFYQPSTIGDYVWGESDQDGIQEAGEPAMNGITVRLYAQGVATALLTVTTNIGGAYSFAGLVPGIYFVEFVAPSGYVFTPQDRGTDDTRDSDANPTTGRTVTTTITSGDNETQWDAGLRLAAVGNFVWDDADADGIQDYGEGGHNAVTVRLYNAAGTLLATTTTAGGGLYSFTNLLVSTYFIEFVEPPSYDFTLRDAGGNDALDSDANTSTGRTINFALTSGQINNNWDAGLTQ